MTSIMDKCKRVIIWGIDDYNVLGLCRQLGSCGYHVLFLAYRGSSGCATSSKYCHQFIDVPSIEEGYDYLMNHVARKDEKQVLINSNDLLAEFIDLHQKELSPYFYLTCSGTPGNVAKYDDKYLMIELALSLGFTTPKTQLCMWNTDISNVKYPCILKPSHQTLGFFNEFKYKICNSNAELRRTLKLVRRTSVFLLQELIPNESVALVYGARLYNGEVLFAGTLLKDRFISTGDGSHGVLTSLYPSGVSEEKMKSFLSAIDFYGMFSFEYGVYGGNAYFFEINLRNDGTSHLFFQAGVNLPLIWAESCYGRDYTILPSRIQGECYFIDEVFDVENVKKKLINKSEWEREKAEATIFKYYASDDLRPYQNVTKGKIVSKYKKAFVSRYRLYIVYLLDRIGLKRN